MWISHLGVTMLKKNAPSYEQQQRAFRLRSLIGEKLSLLDGHRYARVHPSAGLHYMIGLHVPEAVIMEALGKTNDAVMNATGAGDDRRPVVNASAYFTATVRELCRERGIATPIHWGKR
jgi:hypothetical protein